MSDPKYITVSFSISADEAAEIVEALDAIAQREDRSRSRVIVRALRFFLIHHSADAIVAPVEVEVTP